MVGLHTLSNQDYDKNQSFKVGLRNVYIQSVSDSEHCHWLLYAVDYVLLDIIMSIKFFFIPNPVLSISSLFIRIQPGNTARVSAVQPQDCWLLCQRSDNTNLELSNNCSCRLFILSGWTVFTSCCCSSPVHSADSNSTMPAGETWQRFVLEAQWYW